jgi:2-oxoglutarate dehydrogenase complex dehydrogenase (E1) component-like enzyme
MGTWNFLCSRIRQNLQPGRPLDVIARPESASPATGSLRMHRKEQAALIQAAFE